MFHLQHEKHDALLLQKDVEHNELCSIFSWPGSSIPSRYYLPLVVVTLVMFFTWSLILSYGLEQLFHLFFSPKKLFQVVSVMAVFCKSIIGKKICCDAIYREPQKLKFLRAFSVFFSSHNCKSLHWFKCKYNKYQCNTASISASNIRTGDSNVSTNTSASTISISASSISTIISEASIVIAVASTSASIVSTRSNTVSSSSNTVGTTLKVCHWSKWPTDICTVLHPGLFQSAL